MISTTMAKLISLLPKRLVAFISKKVINGYLKRHANLIIKGQKHLERIKTPTIFICNHLSNADGLVLTKALKKVDPTFVAGQKLSKNAVTSIGVNVVKTTNIIPNSADHEGIRKVIDLVKSGESILLFPEGTRSRVGSLIEAKRGVLMIAKKTGAPIIPVGLWGTEKLLPINETGDMSSERFQDADVHIHIGRQFQLPKKDANVNKRDYEAETLIMLMKKIAELIPESYRGVYQ